MGATNLGIIGHAQGTWSMPALQQTEEGDDDESDEQAEESTPTNPAS